MDNFYQIFNILLSNFVIQWIWQDILQTASYKHNTIVYHWLVRGLAQEKFETRIFGFIVALGCYNTTTTVAITEVYPSHSLASWNQLWPQHLI